jgi:prefoldin beta subunit|tara:strand:- start:177 stop:512 length:336 start_codon:yes stop_codon:yes gene_type:complete
MAEMNKETEQKINQLQLFEQSMQTILSQKQQFQMQLVEVESALNELGKTDEAYKIVGNIMVASDKKDLIADLKSKKEIVDLRLKTLEKQENQIREKAEKLQSEVLKKIKNE